MSALGPARSPRPGEWRRQPRRSWRCVVHTRRSATLHDTRQQCRSATKPRI